MAELLIYIILGLFLIGIFAGVLASALSGAISFGWKYAPYILIILFIFWIVAQ